MGSYAGIKATQFPTIFLSQLSQSHNGLSFFKNDFQLQRLLQVFRLFWDSGTLYSLLYQFNRFKEKGKMV